MDSLFNVPPIAYANNEGSDEPAHSCNITTAFAVRVEKEAK